MFFKVSKSGFIETLKGFTLGLLVAIGTFPENDWTFTIGIDSPLSWAFNHLYNQGLNLGKNIVFPHGPLAFFMYPLQENILIATVITAALKMLLVFNILWLSNYSGKTKWILSFIFAYLISIVAGFPYLILANLILLYVNFYSHENWLFKLGAFILTAFACYVKAPVAIISGVICLSFLSYYFFKERNLKKLGLDVLTILGLLLLLWFSMYGTFSGFLTYLFGMVHLAGDNSSAASYYPYNNWWVLFFFLLTLFTIPVVNRTKKSLFFTVLVALSVFAAWKHGMAREDIYHVKSLLIYLLIILFIFILFHEQKFFLNITLSILSIFLLGMNMKNSRDYFMPKYELFGTTNFIEFVSDFSKLKDKANKEISYNISENKLPQSLLDSINSQTVDIYPCDYSVLAANNLNWKPRVVIQSYAAYTTWLDQQNAQHFDSQNAPTFLIWKLEKLLNDVNGGDYHSIDYRYILNDEPQTMVQILRNYKPYYQDNKFMVFKKKVFPIELTSSSIQRATSKWGQWMSVPNIHGGLERVKLTFQKSVLERIKSFLYKDEQFWIYLKLSDGIIHKYRIVPKNAEDGIWINPYFLYSSNSQIEQPVKNIMFKCSNQEIISDNLGVEWEKYDFNNDPNYVLNFFGKTGNVADSTFYSSINTFEKPEFSHWTKSLSEQITKSDSYSSARSSILKANSYSSTFSLLLDSLRFKELKISADCWVKSKSYNYSNNVSIVLSIDDSSSNIIWKAVSIDDQLIDRKQWNNIYSLINYKTEKKGCLLKAYLMNMGNKDVYLDDFRVIINGAH